MKILKHGILPSIEEDRRSCWPSICRLADGRLAAVFSGGRTAHVDPYGRVDITYSSDEGATWTKPITIFDTPLDDRDAGIVNWKGKTVVTTFNNTIFMQMRNFIQWRDYCWDAEWQKIIGDYLVNFPMKDEKKYLGSILLISEDGQNFTEEIKLPVTAPHGPVVLKDGTLFYVGGAYQSHNSEENTDELPTGIYVMATKDGQNWTVPTALPKVDFAALYEPHAVECNDGRVLIFARAEQYATGGTMTILYTYTTDGGKTFEPWKNLGVEGNVGPTQVIKLKDGRILASFGKRDEPCGIRAVVSEDDGATWSEQLVIRDDGMDWDLGYPCSVELKNGNILTVYYFKTPNLDIQRIHYTIWSI
ncbi:MAG: exo-alpha-sialidase [Clostridia bacterium]|nr:exo-alpha-sialidase [Clostridia bacterium]